MGKATYLGFAKSAAEMPFQGGFVTGANLRSSSKPKSPKPAETEAPEAEASSSSASPTEKDN
jgi:hypothetical protein